MKNIDSSMTKHIHAFGELLMPQSKTWNELGLHMNCVSLNPNCHKSSLPVS